MVILLFWKTAELGMTCEGVVAHMSEMKKIERVKLLDFRFHSEAMMKIMALGAMKERGLNKIIV